MGSQEIITIENDFTLIRFQSDENESFHVKKHINQGLIQFHFGIRILFAKCSYRRIARQEDPQLQCSVQVRRGRQRCKWHACACQWCAGGGERVKTSTAATHTENRTEFLFFHRATRRNFVESLIS